MKNLVFALIFTALYAVLASNSYAYSEPTFPSCLNPQGSVKVSYSTGTHGIPGRFSEYNGRDTVYRLENNNTLMQCFCSIDGASGVQTDWWKATNLSTTDIQTLRGKGWVYIPNGSLWGLDNDPYLAKNTDYSCDGKVAGASDEKVLGLAATGNMFQILSFITLGLTFIISGLSIRKFFNK